MDAKKLALKLLSPPEIATAWVFRWPGESNVYYVASVATGDVFDCEVRVVAEGGFYSVRFELFEFYRKMEPHRRRKTNYAS